MEAAPGALGPAAAEVGPAQQPARLGLNLPQDAGDGQPARRLGQRAAAEIAHRLEMHAAQGLAARERKAQDAAYLVLVHARRESRHEHDGQARRRAVVYSAQLLRRNIPAPERLIARRAQAVELQKDAGDPGLAQCRRVIRLRGEAQAVGVQLEEGKAPLPAEAHYLGQVVPHGRLPARELDIVRSAALHEHVVERRDLVYRQVALAARGGEADRAAQVAAVRQLQQDAAARALVVPAQAAGAGAVILRLGRGGRAAPGEVGLAPLLPDEHVKKAVLGAGLYEVNEPVPGHGLLGVHRPQADGADAFCFGKDLVHQARPRSESSSAHLA